MTARTAFRQVVLGLPADSSGWAATFRRRKRYSAAARFGEADGDRLLRRARTVLALADVMYLLANELARLS